MFLFPSILSLYVFLRRLAQKYKRDRPTKHFLSPYQPHILDSNGVWYSLFWLEGPKNHQNLKILVSNFVPGGFEARRTWGFEAQRDGVWRGGAGVLRHSAMGFGGTAPWGLEGRRTDKTLQ